MRTLVIFLGLLLCSNVAKAEADYSNKAIQNNATLQLQTLSDKYPWYQWKIVGEATLEWGIWDIYHSELKTPTGRYKGTQDDLALIILYLRNIDKDALLDATEEQWQHLGYSSQQITPWLKTLSTIWPDVKKGDRLTFVLRNGEGQFYQQSKPLGKVLSPSLSQSFIAIWLSPKTSYPELRQQLIGK
ncbi:chalcone isomerase family protein [Photobacterium sp. GB-210]|uniref:chalcone isomerase family protein n=1 Tax=Photobacterium sp. GB-210 TaxID=2022104 RepID=UPI000D16D18F|nr:chalcone isomerase family protein [Photobacterium sp. GB-210]PSV37335.1 hypothetical protein C9J38_11245 [Photobacterium sp. GB-210]